MVVEGLNHMLGDIIEIDIEMNVKLIIIKHVNKCISSSGAYVHVFFPKF